ncbi:hypothetical protein B0H13DRAFT_2063884 [Mycena leptocephala]|nr:hypothetical protein B0H13DRAFT_2063884 [Mycena leptocephala]
MLNGLEVDRARIADIEAQILDLERSLAALQAEKTIAQVRLQSYKYPVLTLPNEIISEIFIHFLPVYPDCPPLTGILSPTSLTQICRKWREVALATPSLWRAIAFTDYHISFERRSDIYDFWLKRSKSCPLSLHIDEFYEDQIDVSDSEISAVISHRARWEYLKLHLVQSHPVFDGPMPLLRHLHLYRENIDLLPFGHAPLLRTAVLNDDAARSVALPWAQLASLTLRYMDPSDCLPILKQASNLVHCTLHVWDGDDSDQPGPITLPHLKSLTLRNLGNPGRPRDAESVQYLDAFITPALCSLEIPERFFRSDPINSLTSYISKSGCKLQDVHITGQTSVPEDSYRNGFPSIPEFYFSEEL